MSITYIGYAAAIFTTASFIPQVYKLWKTRKTKGLSLPMYLIYATGVFLWTVYGIMLNNIAIIAANCITFILVLPILIMEVKDRAS